MGGQEISDKESSRNKMAFRRALATAALVAGSAAQFAQFSDSGYGISVNVPSDTASSGSGSIYVQISAPSGTEWIGFGQGSQMSGANMFVVYAADSTNVTVSPRLGTGHTQPQVNGDAQISVLEGTGIASDGSLVANVRCECHLDACRPWTWCQASQQTQQGRRVPSSHWLHRCSVDGVLPTSTGAVAASSIPQEGYPQPYGSWSPMAWSCLHPVGYCQRRSGLQASWHSGE